jgi:hypothetical protein
MTSSDRIIEILHFRGGLNHIFVGSDGIDRPAWLPDSSLVGLHNDIRPQKDDFIIEYSRHKRDGCYITWIGVYTYGVDEIYGDRSNFTGIGIWLRNYIPTDPESFLDALIKILRKIIETTVQEGIQQCGRLLQSQDGFIDNWVIKCEVLPKINDGIPFNSTAHPQTIYIDAASSDFAHALNEISTNILINSFKVDSDIKIYNRLIFLLVGDEALRTVNAKNIIKLKTKNVAQVILDYFIDGQQSLKDELNKNKKIAINNADMLEKCQEELISKKRQGDDIKLEINRINDENKILKSNLDEQNQIIIKSRNYEKYIQKIRTVLDIRGLHNILIEINANSEILNLLSKQYSNPNALIDTTRSQYPGSVFNGGDNKRYSQRELDEITKILLEIQEKQEYIYRYKREDDRLNYIKELVIKLNSAVTNITADARFNIFITLAAVAVLLISGPLFNYFIHRIGYERYERLQSSNEAHLQNLEGMVGTIYKNIIMINSNKQSVSDEGYEKNKGKDAMGSPKPSSITKQKTPQ